MIRNKIIRDDIGYIVSRDLPWDILAGSTFLISGANGFLPAYMVEVLLLLNDRFNMNINVIGLARNKDKTLKRFNHHNNRKDLNFIYQDVCYPLDLKNVGKPDFIVHAASQASPKFYGSDPIGTITPNITGTLNLLNVARENNSKAFLYFSSGEVYGNIDGDKIPTSENDYGLLDPTNLRSCYGESKRMGENLCVSYSHQYNVPVKIVRPFHTYGPGVDLNDGRVFADFISDVVNDRDIVLSSDGSARRAFCYLADATLGFFYVLLKGKSREAYNVGSDNETSIMELANLLVGLFPEKNLKVVFTRAEVPNGYLKSTISRGCPKIDKIRELGWSPETDIKTGFYKTIKSFELRNF